MIWYHAISSSQITPHYVIWNLQFQPNFLQKDLSISILFVRKSVKLSCDANFLPLAFSSQELMASKRKFKVTWNDVLHFLFSFGGEGKWGYDYSKKIEGMIFRKKNLGWWWFHMKTDWKLFDDSLYTWLLLFKNNMFIHVDSHIFL